MEIFPDIPLPEPQQRTVDAMRAVLADGDCPASGPLYFMYRSLAQNESDRLWLEEHRIRYDLTVIPAATLCSEFVKTKGHYHPVNPAGVGYTELYQVISGQAHYLLQKEDCSDAVVVRAAAGDVVLIPPGYGHVTINPAEEELAMVNLVSASFASVYAPFEERRGAAFYEMCSGWEKNPHYPLHPVLRFEDAREYPEYGILHGRRIYDLIGSEDIAGILNRPEKYPALF
ncbi:MAG TPA: glucose-6-phosphate isomerase [Methanoculleus sp.]|nr:glucose-6-phosphate isomerase [Methanoculleus sp.]